MYAWICSEFCLLVYLIELFESWKCEFEGGSLPHQIIAYLCKKIVLIIVTKFLLAEPQKVTEGSCIASGFSSCFTLEEAIKFKAVLFRMLIILLYTKMFMSQT